MKKAGSDGNPMKITALLPSWLPTLLEAVIRSSDRQDLV
jgi:hypothetical protein